MTDTFHEVPVHIGRYGLPNKRDVCILLCQRGYRNVKGWSAKKIEREWNDMIPNVKTSIEGHVINIECINQVYKWGLY